MNPAVFLALTKRDQYEQVKQNIDQLLLRNFSVKINMVVIQGINDAEINNFIEWTRNVPVHIRLIEFMPFTSNQWTHQHVFTYQQMLNRIEERYSIEKLDDELHDTTKKYHVPGFAGTFAVISTMTAPFCSTCNRLRLTADGKMKNCLFSTTEADLLGALRAGNQTKPLIIEHLNLKHAALGGQLPSDYNMVDTTALENRRMIAIGG